MRENISRKDITNELKEAVADYLVKRVFAEVTTEAVEKIQSANLARNPLPGGKCHPKPITDPDKSYCCEDEKALLAYYRENDRLEREAGLKPDTMKLDYCPALVARTEQTEAEWRLVDEMARILESGYKPGKFNNLLMCEPNGKGLERRQEFIDCVVGLVLSLDK